MKSSMRNLVSTHFMKDFYGKNVAKSKNKNIRDFFSNFFPFFFLLTFSYLRKISRKNNVAIFFCDFQLEVLKFWARTARVLAKAPERGVSASLF